MSLRALFTTGLTGASVSGVCCFTPALVYGLGAFGLSAALAWVDIVLLPVFGLSLGLLGVAGFRWWRGRVDDDKACDS